MKLKMVENVSNIPLDDLLSTKQGRSEDIKAKLSTGKLQVEVNV